MEARCPVCGDPSGAWVMQHTDFPESAVYRCDACAHHYCSPEPSDAALARHYEITYAASRRAYFGRRYLNIMRRRARAQADFIERHARAGRCVDLGCGIGALVAELESRGWTARGTDTDPAAVAFGRRRAFGNLAVASVQDFLSDPGSPDLVCLSHVVEHMNGLPDSLGRIAATLRPGGMLFIEVPNQTGSPAGDLESHLHFFSSRSLRRLLARLGLTTLACVCCGPSHARGTATNGSRRALARARAWWQTLTGTTDWDGWYDKYHEGEEGMWIRCVAVRSPT